MSKAFALVVALLSALALPCLAGPSELLAGHWKHVLSGFLSQLHEMCYNRVMVTISIKDIQRDLVGYLRRVKAGETLLILEANQPLAEIKPLSDLVVGVGEPRPFGLCAGEFVVPDDFDAPLPKDVLRDFERL